MKISIFLPNYNLFLLISLTGFGIDEILKPLHDHICKPTLALLDVAKDASERPCASGWVRTWQRSLHGAVVALLSDLVVRVAQLYPCCASGARQRPRTVRLTHGCANSAPKARPLTRQCQLGTSISDRLRSSEFYTSSAAVAASVF